MPGVRIMLGALGLLAAAYWLFGGSAGRSFTFDVPAASAIDRLVAGKRVVNGSGMGSLDLSGVRLSSGNGARIGVRRAGDPQTLWCRAEVTELGAGRSSVAVDCAQDAGNGTARAALARQLGGEALAIVVSEHVAATVEKRPYDTDRVGDQMLLFAARHAPAMAIGLK